MKGDLFFQWVQEKVASHLEEPLLIMIDNASYNTVVFEQHPTNAWTNAHIQQWLDIHNIVFATGKFKPKLLALVRAHAPDKQYYMNSD